MLLCIPIGIGCGSISNPSASSGLDAKDDAGGGVAGDGSWEIITSQAPVSTGNLSVMVDAEGVPHVAYSSSVQELWHAWLTNGSLEAELIDTFSRGMRKAWVPGSPEPRLVYDSLTFNVVGFQSVRNAPGAWTVEPLVYDELSGGASAVWIDGSLRTARLVAGTEEVAGKVLARHGVVYDGHRLPAEHTRLAGERVSPQLALAMDRNGAAHIVYSAPADDYELYTPGDESLPHTVRYVAVSNGQWSEPVVLSDANAGQYSGLSIAVDGTDTIHVGFSELSSYDLNGDVTPSSQLHHLSRGVRAEWTDEVIPTGAPARSGRGSMALDQAGEPHFAYCFAEAGQDRCSAIGYVHRRVDKWYAEAIQVGCDRLGEEAAIAIGTQGQAFVAYRGCDGQLVLAERQQTASHASTDKSLSR